VNTRRANIHPAEVLREEYLDPPGLTPDRLAREIGVPYTRVDAILKDRRAITADTAHRRARYFCGNARWWLNLQAQYDLREALTPELAADLERITPHPMTHLEEDAAAA
jgi:addiction module HigA family antidote